MLVLRGVGRQGSGQERGRGFCQDRYRRQHRCPRRGAGLGTALIPANGGVNLSTETSKRAGKYSSARLAGKHQRSRLLCCQPKPCSVSRFSSEVRDCGLKGGKSKIKVFKAVWLCLGWFAGCWLSLLLPGSVWMALVREGGQDCKLLPWSLRWLRESGTSLAAVGPGERQIRAVRGS